MKIALIFLTLFAIFLVDLSGPNETPVVVLNDSLWGSTVGKAEGGKFVEGGGWIVAGLSDRIVWKLPWYVDEGAFELDIRNFDTRKQLDVAKNSIIGMWKQLWKCYQQGPDCDNRIFRVGRNYQNFKVKIHTNGEKRFEKQFDTVNKFDPERTYYLKVKWKAGKVAFSLDGVRFPVFDNNLTDPVNRLKYIHIGSNNFFTGRTIEPIYSNLKITKY